MATKILLGPSCRGDSFIVGEDGSLKVIDVPRRCWGRRTCCACPECVKRDAKARKSAERAVRVCVCECPMMAEKLCLKCGKRPLGAAA